MFSIHKMVEDEYANIRSGNDERTLARLSEIHAKIPEIARIDEKLREFRRELLQNVLTPEKSVEDIENGIKDLLKARRQLLGEGGYGNDYTDRIVTCRQCNDTGFIGNKKCGCYNDKRIKYLYEYANISPIMQRQLFENFDFELYSKEVSKRDGISPYDNIKEIYNVAVNYVDNGEYKNGKNLFLYGPPGTGKTFLCSCIASGLIKKNEPVFYQSAYKIFSAIEGYKFNSGQDENSKQLVDIFYDVSVLIIDDLGTEFKSRFTDAAFFDLLNTRLQDQKSTIISSNLAGLDDDYSPRIQSRILGDYMLLQFIGEDIRKAKGVN